jgi:chemotaxis protein CheD
VVVSDIADDVLVAYGLGSCVAICLYDPVVKVGGMLHALLPSAATTTRSANPQAAYPSAKFVDQGLPLLLDELAKMGAKSSRLTAKLCGGAQVLSAPGFEEDSTLNIGKRNVTAAADALKKAGIRVQAQDTGGKIGRTVKLHIADGQVTVKSLGQGEKPLR